MTKRTNAPYRVYLLASAWLVLMLAASVVYALGLMRLIRSGTDLSAEQIAQCSLIVNIAFFSVVNTLTALAGTIAGKRATGAWVDQNDLMCLGAGLLLGGLHAWVLPTLVMVGPDVSGPARSVALVGLTCLTVGSTMIRKVVSELPRTVRSCFSLRDAPKTKDSKAS